MQRDTVESVLADGLGRQSHLFDRAGTIIAAAGTRHRNLRRIGFASLDEKILADANGLAFVHACDMIDAIAIHLNGAVIHIILATAELNLLSAIELQLAPRERPVGRNIQFGFGSDDGAQVAAAFFNVGGHAGPGRVMIGDADLFHGR